MILKKCILTASYNYQWTVNAKPGSGITTNHRFITPKGIVVHSTGTPAPNLLTYVQPLPWESGDIDYDRYAQLYDPDYPNYLDVYDDIGKNHAKAGWNSTEKDAGIHAFVGKNKLGVVEVYQVLPYNVPAFGVANGTMVRKGAPYYTTSSMTTQAGVLTEDTKGKGFGGSYSYITIEINGTTYYANYSDGISLNFDPQSHIQFEMCEDSLFDPQYFNEVMKTAKEYCAYLCVLFGWDSSVIISHKEAHTAGYGSNHGDCDNWLVRFDMSMDDFRADVQRLIDNMSVDEKLNIQSQRYKTDYEATL